MAEWQEWTGKNAGLFALLALLLALTAVIFLLVVYARQKRADRKAARRYEGMLRQMEENARDALGRGDYTNLSESQAARLMQAMEERSRDEAMRLSELSKRLDAFGESQDQRLHRVSAQLDEKLALNEARMENMRRTLDAGVTRLQEENAKKLEEMRQTVDEKLHATLDKRLGESFSLVNERLEQVYKGLGEMQTLASGVGDLKKVLTNVKTRGVWGEMQLGALLSQVLSPNQYEENAAVVPGSPQRVEFAVKLPGQGEGTVLLPIDSKFPIEDYERLLAAYDIGDQAVIAAASSALTTALKVEAKRISSKYIAPPATTDFAIIFLPFEGLYAEAVNRGMVEELQKRYKVNLAGPSTMAALLNSLQMGFRTLAIEKRSSEVWEILRSVRTEFDKFGDVLEASQRHLQQVSGDLDQLVGVRTRQIQSKLKNVEKLEDGQ